jgi:glycosyltransferase involved in cell wall biosynthesis
VRILLTSNASYLPPRGGSTRSNLAYLEALAERGHSVRVVAAAADVHSEAQRALVRQELSEQQMDARFVPQLEQNAIAMGRLNNLEIVCVRDYSRHMRVLEEQIQDFKPDWVLVSSEDLSHVLLREAARCVAGRLIYVAHTPQFFPFGPASWHTDAAATEAVRQAAAVVVISHAMREYVLRHLGREAAVIHPPIYGPLVEQSAQRLGDYDQGAVAMINPCAVKGLSLFLGLADLLPDERFAVLPGWGTSSHNLAQLRARGNISIWPRVRRIEDFLSRVKVLLIPSLWLEGFGLIAAEAMLRGVPVIASDSGGLREAKAGTDFLIPVRLIEEYEPVFDDRNMPRPVLPEQDVTPWLEGLRQLLRTRAAYEDQCARQQEAAASFAKGVDRFQLEKLLLALEAPGVHQRVALATHAVVPEQLGGLSEAKRALLLKRMRARRAVNQSSAQGAKQ